MSVSPDKYVASALKKVTAAYDGLSEVIDEITKMITPEFERFGEAVRKEAVATMASQGGGSEPQMPKLTRVTSYILYQKDFRDQNPGLKQELFKECAASWKKQTDAKKASYKKQSDDENVRLREEYVAANGSLPPRGGKKAQRTKPKQTNPFQEFVSEFRLSHKDIKHTEMFGEASVEWHKLTDKKKQKYVDIANENREKYKAEFEEQKKNNPGLAVAVEVKKRKAKVKKERPPTRSAYIRYGDHWRAELNAEKLVGKVAMATIAKEWREIKVREKNKLTKQAKEANEKIEETWMTEHPEADWTTKKLASREKAAASS